MVLSRSFMPNLRFHLRPLAAANGRGRHLTTGDGPPVVLLASPLAFGRVYRPTVRALANSHQVHLIEPPGSGWADRLTVAWGIEEYAEWMAAALEVLNLRDATVIGHSHAGGVALVLAERFPERVGRIVMAAAMGACQQSIGSALFGRFRDAVAVERRLSAWEAVPLSVSAARHWRNFARQTRVALSTDLSASAARVAVPALIAWGTRDHTYPQECAARYARLLPQAEVYLSTGGAHAWPITHAAEFAAVVGAFIRRTSSNRATATPSATPGPSAPG